MPHVVELFYSGHCLGCPEALALLRRLASQRCDVTVIDHDIDHDEALELAKAYDLIATPALVINRRTVIYGIPRLEILTARIDASAAPPS